MAMSWSHGSEAQGYAMNMVYKLPRHKLKTIWAEIKSTDKDEYGCYPSSTSNFDENRYEQEELKADTHPNDVLALDIWEFMLEHRTCDNDFKNAWCCPYGCGCHKVPFGPEREE